MKYIYPIIIFFAFLYSCRAQVDGDKLRELHKLLAGAEEDTLIAMALANLGRFHAEDLMARDVVQKNVDSAYFYTRKAESLSQKINYKNGIGASYVNLSIIIRYEGDKTIATSYAQKAIDIGLSCKNDVLLGDGYVALAQANDTGRSAAENISLFEKAYHAYIAGKSYTNSAIVLTTVGNYYRGLRNYSKSSEKFLDVLEAYKKAKIENVMPIYTLLSSNYQQAGDYLKAVEYGLKGVRIAEKFNDNSVDTGLLYFHLGHMNAEGLNNMNEAYEHFKKAEAIIRRYNYPSLLVDIEGYLSFTLIRLKRNEEAIKYLDILEPKCSSLNHEVSSVAVLRCLQGYTALKKYDKAATFIPQAKKLAHDELYKSLVCATLAQFYIKTEEYDSARLYANMEKDIYESQQNLLALKYAHRRLFMIDSAQSRYASSLEHLKKEHIYASRLNEQVKSREISELQIEYDTEKKNHKILIQQNKNLQLEKQAEIQNARLSNETLLNYINIAGIVFLTVIGTFIYRRYYINRKIRREIYLKNDTLQHLLNEKEWLLREIHHRVKNNLQIVMSLLNTQSHFLNDHASREAIKNSQHRIYSMSLIHKKLYQSKNSGTINMEVYIRELVEYFKSVFNTGSHIRFEIATEPIDLKISQAVLLGLIINEIIINAITYAFPEGNGNIMISLNRVGENNILLNIKDKGLNKGLNHEYFEALGIKLIKGFGNDLGGRLLFGDDNWFSFTLEFEHDKKTDINKASA